MLPVLVVAWVLLNPPKADMEGFSWTQTSEQNDWAISLPKEEGFDQEVLLDLHEQVSLKKTKKVQSLLIARDGHNWWFPFITVDGEKLMIAGMRSAGGQEMFIIPEMKLVITMTSGAYIRQDEDYPFELIVNYILPSLGINNAKYTPRV